MNKLTKTKIKVLKNYQMANIRKVEICRNQLK